VGNFDGRGGHRAERQYLRNTSFLYLPLWGVVVNASNLMAELRCLALAVVLVIATAVGAEAWTSGDVAGLKHRGQQPDALTQYVEELKHRAQQGDVVTQLLLAHHYAAGSGVPQNHAEAVKWYRKAADQGYTKAQMNLGVAYSLGEGIPQNDAEAVKWYRKAADQGNAEAQFNLGLAYRMGKGVPQNFIHAHMWFNLAASNTAGKARDKAVGSLNFAISKMTSQQIAEAQKLASEWKPK
jgi:TPR repeat protein